MNAVVPMRVVIGPSSFAAEDRTPWRMLEEAGVEIVPNPVGRRWTEAEALEFLQGIDGLVAGLEPLNRRVLTSTGGRLKALARVGIGMNNVDVVAARELGIAVSNTPDAPTEAVAEMTLAALLSLARELEPMNRALHAGQWPKTIGRSLRELVLLVIGFGRIGRAVAELLRSLGCSILIHDPFLSEDRRQGYEHVSLEDGLARADAVTLHAAGDQPLLGQAEFGRMKAGAILLNAGRGELVDEAALCEALDSGRVAKAWFDTFWKEPYTGPLLKYPQILLTPHASTYTRRCRLSMETEAVRNLLRDLGLAGGK